MACQWLMQATTKMSRWLPSGPWSSYNRCTFHKLLTDGVFNLVACLVKCFECFNIKLLCNRNRSTNLSNCHSLHTLIPSCYNLPTMSALLCR